MTQPESADRTLRLLERGLSEAAGSQKLQWLSVPAPLLRAEALLGVEPHADAWYWSNGGDREFVGIGVAKRLTGHGPERFEKVDRDLQELWRSLEPHAATPEGAPEPRVVGGFAFQNGRASSPPWDGFGEGQLVLPRLTYTRQEGRAWLTLAAAPHELASAAERARFLDEAAQLVAAAEAGARPEQDSAPGPFELAERSADEWRAQIDQVKRAIATGAFQKVVLARRVLVRFARELSAARTLSRLRESSPLSPRFAFRVDGVTFLGSPPERLLAKNGLHIETEAVAGTLPASDVGAAEHLVSDAKLLAEHAPVVQDLVERLRPVADLQPLPARPLPHRARHVLHLKTPISATLRAPERALSLLSRIHPTPAVGGYPTQPALRFIAEHEPDERGWYAGPIGWIDAHDNADFAVALRSGVIAGKQAHLYVGAGIVSGSDSDSELQETGWKLKVLLSALG
ncbi:MAG TPA: isochorismate synthase [Polyangiaceae bacterium]|nr:isochorismate synthase [Polyangiaceae bacterium]